MAPELLDYYLRQLTYVTGLFSEFAQKHPKIAARLGAHGNEVRDPYIDRLLQAYALSAAHSEMRIDRWPLEIPQRLLDCIDVNFNAPLPSLGVTRFQPDAKGVHTPEGALLPRDTRLSMGTSGPEYSDGQTECVFLTTQAVTIWPLRISRVRLTGIPADIPAMYRYLRDGGDVSRVRGAIRLRLSSLKETRIAKLAGLDRLPVYLCGEPALASQLFELIHTSVIGMVMGAPDAFEGGELYGIDRSGRPAMRVEYEGLEPEGSLLRPVLPKWHGQRLVHDFFAMPERFWFFALSGLAAGLKDIPGAEVEIVLLLSRDVTTLEQQVDTDDFALYCTPVVNLTQQRTTRMVLDPTQAEHRLVSAVGKATDYQVHSVVKAYAQVDENSPVLGYEPLDVALPDDTQRTPRYFRLCRTQELIPDNMRRYETRKEAVQTRTAIRFYDARHEPDDTDVTLLEIDAWLTNGDLPCVMPRRATGDLDVKNAKAVNRVDFVRGPTPPRPPLTLGARGDAAWHLVYQLQLPLAVFDDESGDPDPGAGLRLWLTHYLSAGDTTMARFLASLCGASVAPVLAMHCIDGDMAPMRGLAVTLTFDESKLEGWSPFTFALALERYVARHVSGLSFTHARLAASPHLIREARSPDALAASTAWHFGVPVRIEELSDDWIALPSELQCRMGQEVGAATLGCGAMLGGHVFSRSHRFCMVIGPVDLETYQRFTPQGKDLLRLIAWVRAYIGREYEWLLELQIRPDCMPEAMLGDQHKLGWSSWMGRQAGRQPVVGMRIEPEQYLRQLAVDGRNDGRMSPMLPVGGVHDVSC